jgi:death-on-curing protein
LENIEYLTLAEFLLVAEVATGVPAETLSRLPSLGLAESALNAPAASFGGVDFYPEFVDRAAVLCARIARNHSLPDGNKRTAFLCLIEFVERNGRRWADSERDPEESVAMIEAVAAGTLNETQLAVWIRSRVTER